MQYPYGSNAQRRFGKVEYVVAEVDSRPRQSEHDYADNPCQSGSEAECAEWLNELLTACYND